MREVTAVEAKVRFGAVLEAVERGEEIVVTKNGRRVARISPIDGPRRSREEAIAKLKTFATGRKLGDVDWHALRDEGRK